LGLQDLVDVGAVGSKKPLLVSMLQQVWSCSSLNIGAGLVGIHWHPIDLHDITLSYFIYLPIGVS
jgi:hypothetical protein